MVDQSNIGDIVRLNNEYQNSVRAISNLDDGGRIASMVINGPDVPNQPPRASAVVPTGYVDYPPGMALSIRNLLVARVDEIRQELAALGVTGLG